MSARAIFDESEAAIGEGRQWLSVLLIYEDFSTGLRAKLLCDQVVNSLKLEVDFRVSLWRFDILREPALLERATDEAAKADIVFLSAHGPSDLPTAINLWFNQWLERRRDEPCALVVPLDVNAQDSAVAAQVIGWLQAAAGPKGVTVFPHFGEPPPSEGDLTIEAIHRRAHTKTATLDDIQRWPGSNSHFGINE